jgi:hypothetical protein
MDWIGLVREMVRYAFARRGFADYVGYGAPDERGRNRASGGGHDKANEVVRA